MSVWIDSSGGGAIMLFCTFQFFVVLTFAPRYGLISRWLSKRRIIPQELREDILVTVHRSEGEPVKYEKIYSYIHVFRKHLKKGVRLLQAEGLLKADSGGYILTTVGKREANRVLRAHRLWESYLDHVGTPAENLHPTAHRLEHVRDSGSVDYLDGLLGHPVHDPHGEVIPEDRDRLIHGKTVQLSLLREGHSGKVAEVGEYGSEAGIRKGQKIIIGERAGKGDEWIVKFPTGKKITVDHRTADDIYIRFEESQK